jgi:hypothetical protein
MKMKHLESHVTNYSPASSCKEEGEEEENENDD